MAADGNRDNLLHRLEFLASDLAAWPFALWLVHAYPALKPAGSEQPTWLAAAQDWSGLNASGRNVTEAPVLTGQSPTARRRFS